MEKLCQSNTKHCGPQVVHSVLLLLLLLFIGICLIYPSSSSLLLTKHLSGMHFVVCCGLVFGNADKSVF
jgi:hypothetical protein